MEFDAIILGTSLTESILAASLSKSGFKVAHIDVDKWYGGDEASLSLDELLQWSEQTRACSHGQRYTHIQVHNSLSIESLQRESRFYALSLCPSIIPSVGPIIASLVSSGVARYGGFKLVDHISIYDASSSSTPPSFKSVPSRREDVFTNAEISLVEKRRIMRFLTFAASSESEPSQLGSTVGTVGEEEQEGQEGQGLIHFIQTKFGASESTAAAIGYALAFCTSPSDRVRPALTRLRRYVRSSGRYGPSPFLIGQYGGTGEMAQGFCRAAAVHGAVYILGREVFSVTGPSEEDGEGGLITVTVQDVPDPLKCKLLIASPRMAEYLSSSSSLSRLDHPMFIPNTGYEDLAHSVARCIAIVDFPLLPPTSQVVAPPPPPSPQREGGSDGNQETPVSPVRPHRDTEQDTIVFTFPPSSLPSNMGSSTHACTVLVTGPGTMSTPRGKSVVYLGLPLAPGELRDARTILEPYLRETLSLASSPASHITSDPTPSESEVERTPLFTTFYIEHPYKYGPPPHSPSSSSSTQTRRSAYIVTPPICTDRLPESSDLAAEHAERVFREAVAILQPGAAVSMWPAETEQDKEEEEEEEW